MCKAIRIEEGLRCLRTPGVAGPKKRAAVTPPLAALMMKLPRRKGEDDGDNQTRPGISLVQREHLVCVSAKSLETLSQGAAPASEHRCIAQREAIGFGLAQLLNQIEEIRRIVCLKDDDKFLIVETERVSGV